MKTDIEQPHIVEKNTVYGLLTLRELIGEAECDFGRFELPICFDPHEEQKELNIRSMRIERICKRYFSML